MTRWLCLCAILSSAALLGACGPATAKYVLDDTALAPVPMADKQAIFAAQNEISQAKAEQQQQQAALDSVDHELDLVKLERDQANNAVKSAKIEIEMADKLKDTARMSSAAEHKRLADLGYDAADAKVTMYEKKRKWAKENVEVAEKKVKAALAKVEAEKARLAASKGIMPTKDFNPNMYIDEYTKRQKDVESEQRDADEAKAKYDEKTATWNQLSTQFQSATNAQQPQRAPAYAPGAPSVPVAPPPHP